MHGEALSGEIYTIYVGILVRDGALHNVTPLPALAAAPE